MKNLKINTSAEEKFNSLIAEVESKAKARLFQSYSHMMIDIEKAESKLKEMGISKKNWVGCSIYMQPESVPNSYKYKAEGTYMIVRYFKTGWFITSCHRGNVKKEAYGGYPPAEIWLTSEAKQSIPNQIKL